MHPVGPMMIVFSMAATFVSPPSGSPAPLGLRVVPILGIVFGTLNLLGNALAIAKAVFSARVFADSSGSPPEMAATMQAMHEMVAVSMRVAIAEGSAMIAMDLALIALSIVLLQTRSEVARKAAVVWSFAAFAVLVGRALLFELVVMPVATRVVSSMASGMASGPGLGGLDMSTTMGLYARAASYVSLGFMAVFPVVVLVVMTSPAALPSVAER